MLAVVLERGLGCQDESQESPSDILYSGTSIPSFYFANLPVHYSELAMLLSTTSRLRARGKGRILRTAEAQWRETVVDYMDCFLETKKTAYQREMAKQVALPDPSEPVDAKLSYMLLDEIGRRHGAYEIREDLSPSRHPINTFEADKARITY